MDLPSCRAHQVVFRSRRLLQSCSVDRQLSQALPGCREDRVGDGGNDGRRPRLAHPARRFRALHDMDLDRRCLIDAKHLVSIEIGLLDTAVLQRDLAMERSRDAEDDGALYLRPDRIGIDDGTAIDPQTTRRTRTVPLLDTSTSATCAM